MADKRILIVEDERIIAEDIKRTLTNFGYIVPAIISAGEIAVKKIDELKPDLILMDIMLEGKMTGIEAASIIKENYRLPIIYLTAYANENTLQSAKITEPFGYIIKPFEERELHATIEMAFYRYKIENALQKKTIQQQQLLESAKHLTSSLDVKEVLTQIGKGAKDILNSYSCAIYLLQENSNLLEPVVAIDPEYEKEILSTKLNLDNSFTGKAVKDKKSFIFNNTANDNTGLIIPGTAEQEEEHVIVAPFCNEDKVLGAMCLSRIGNLFTAEDLTLADAFATYASAALKNAQNHRQLEIEIEERQLAENKLHETQFRLTTIFTNVPNIVIYEKYGGKSFISENVKDLLGYSPQKFLEMDLRFADIVHPRDREFIKNKFDAWFKEGKEDFLTLWYRLKKSDGNYIWIEDRMVKIVPEEGEPYISGVMIDNSNLKKAEEALKESELLYKGVVEDQSELIIRFDGSGKLKFVNEAYCRYYDQDYQKAMTSNWFENFSKEQQQIIVDNLLKLSKQNPTFTFELKEQDQEKWIEWTIRSIFDNNNAIIAFQAVGRTITERKLAEIERENIMNQLIQSQKMEVVGRLAGGVAHDFNNLLTAINGYAGLAYSKLAENNPVRNDIKVIQECGEKAANLTKQLLTFSRKQIVEPKILNINQIIMEVDKMLKRLIGENIELKTVIEDSLKSIKVDKVQLEQILTNLVVNARDAIDENGTITIFTKNITVDKEIDSVHNTIKPGDYVMLSVKDNGHGISEDVMEHIFEPFFTTKDQGKGTGLGLATVFGIIKQNEGAILIESSKDEGSEFKIYFPATDQVAPDSAIEFNEKDLPTGNETILLTEDEESIREFVLDILEEYGYTILEAENGTEALEKAKNYNKNIHLLLSDVVMPSMNGQQLAEALKDVHPETKVMFMSGYTESTAIQKGILELKTGFLQKPFSANDLITKVRKILDS
jgi:two-component system, cell cycle sensor histidine kinase and response regulator CckA